jgi:Na+/glutamate symporter
MTGLLHFAVMANEQPIAIPNHLKIDPVILVTAIEFPFQGGLGVAAA